jgi:predicted permease
MMLDVKAALRALARSPAFAVGTSLTLAIALGLVMTAVGLLFGALGGFRSGAAPGAAILYLTEQVSGGVQRIRWPYAAVENIAARATSFERFASYTTASVNLVAAGRDGERVDIELVSPQYLDVLAVAPALGRPIASPPDDRSQGPDEILVSDALWRRLGATPDVLGRTVRVSQRPLIVVGVLPAGFRGLSGRADVIVPNTLAPVLTFAGYFTSQEYFHNVIARLRSGVTVGQARSELDVIARGLGVTVPPRSDAATARGGDVVLLRDAQINPQTVRARVLIAVGAIFVLLIAAVNVGNLVVARIASRVREFAMRLAVGATRGDVFRGIAVEMAIVTSAGCAVAFLAAVWARDLVAALVPRTLATPANDYSQFATLTDLRLDTQVVIVVAVLAMLTMVVISVIACRPLLKAGLADVLKWGGRAGAGPGATQRLLLMVQVAVSIALLASAGLLFRTVAALGDINPGFDVRNVIAFSVAEDLAAQRPGSGPLLAERMLDAVTRVQGVRDATVAQCTPYGTRCARLAFQIENETRAASQPAVVGWHRVGPNHFAALGIPVLLGRGFSADDRRGRSPVVVINQEAAQRFFADRNPIGQRVRLPQVVEGDPDIAEIVGVVGNVIYWPIDEPAGPDVYQPALQFSYPFTTMMVRTAGDPAQAIPTIREAVRAADSNLPLYDVVTLEELGRAGEADRRFMSVLLAACAGLGLLLAVVGVYALAASWMAARRRELALRVALGAEPRGLVALVMRSTLLQTAAGLVVGVLAALGAGQFLSSMLFGVEPHDPVTVIAAALVMLVVSVAATYVPARRTVRIDPVRELNAE